MSDGPLHEQIRAAAPGPWAVGVSGGADSVALLSMLRQRRDLRLHVVHLDHETRGGESAVDAAFVIDLCRAWDLPVTVARRSDVERSMDDLPANTSARFRAARMELFQRVVREHELRGVILAHHADDQAETVFLRLARGAGIEGVRGMAVQSRVNGLTIVRPLLDVPGKTLRNHLRSIGQAWREDASNESDDYQRNRVRRLLRAHPDLSNALRHLANAARDVRGWLDASAPHLAARFALADVADLPAPVARHALRRWIVERGAPVDDVTSETIDRLLTMATDAATPARQHVPGGRLVRRQGRFIFVEPATR